MDPVLYKYYKVENLSKLKKPTRDSIEEIMSLHRNRSFNIEEFAQETPGAYLLIGVGEDGRVISMLRLFGLTKAIRKRVGYTGQMVGTGYINALVVARAFRGKGYGTELMTFAKKLAKKLGFKKLLLEVVSANGPAMKLYLTSGFSLISSHYWGNESAHLMECKLNGEK